MSDEPLALDLPAYHGRKPVGMRTSITGAGNRIQNEHGIGDRLVLVVECKVRKAGHEDTDDGLLYTEAFKVVDLFEVDPKAGSRLIAALRANARTAADGAEGKEPIEGMAEVGYTDASGVVLTPKELADIRSDPIQAIIGDAVPVVVVYADQQRAIWPDDFAPDTLQPTVGTVVLDGDVPRTVAEILDAQTGEALEAAPAFDGEPLDEGVPELADGVPPLDPDDEDDDPDGIIEVVHLPTKTDFEFVDRGIPDLRDELEEVTDPAQLQRILTAEKQGRGRGLKYRKGALDVIHARIEAVANGVRLEPEV